MILAVADKIKGFEVEGPTEIGINYKVAPEQSPLVLIVVARLPWSLTWIAIIEEGEVP